MNRPVRRSLLLTTICAGLALAACTPRAPQPSVATPPPAPTASAPVTASGKIRVAMLLPLSGRAEALGHALQEAAELALFDGAGRSLALTTYDTGDTPQGAIDAFNKAKAEGTALILGPLFGASARGIAPLARDASLNVISFSNDEQVAQPGLWVMGLAAAPQVQRIVDFAIGRGIRNFAAVAPQTAYGQLTVSALEAQLRSRNVTLAAREFYDAGSDPGPAARKAAANLGGGSGSAIFVPVGGQALPQLLAGLAAGQSGSVKAQIVGTGVWDDLESWQMNSLAGAWFAAPDPAQRADFERRFTATYGKPAPRLATLAYDAVRFAGRLAVRRPGGDFSVAAITDPAGTPGLDGLFRFLSDGRTERALAVLEVSGQRATVIGAPATSFDRPGF